MNSTYSIQQRLLAGATTATGTNVGSILRRLLLFETVILTSNRLQEIPALVQTFGFEQTMTLLGTGMLRIHCYHQAVAQTAQTAIARSAGKPTLPLGSYCVTTMQTADQQEYLSRCLQEIQIAHPLPRKHHKRLKRTVLSAVETPLPTISDDTRTQFRDDLLSAGPLFSKAILRVVAREQGATASLPPLILSIHPLDHEDFHIETNLTTTWGMDEHRAHKIIERAVLSVGVLNFRLAQMKGFTALSGFQDHDLPLFEDKLRFLTKTIDPNLQDERFGRVVRLLGLPDFASVGVDKKIDIHKFLRARNSPECREFRAWLSSIDTATDAEIIARVQSLQARIGSALNLPLIRGIRFLATTGAGMLPVLGPLLGVGTGVLDSFVLERLFPESPIVTFLSNKYPSLFEN